MGAITNIDTVIQARLSGLYYDHWLATHHSGPSVNTGQYFASFEPYASGGTYSYYYNGYMQHVDNDSLPSAGGAGRHYNAYNVDAAMRPFFPSPAGGRQRWLTCVAGGKTGYEHTVADLLWKGWIDANSTSTVSFTMTSLLRHSTEGGQILIYMPRTDIASNAATRTITVSYTNQSGTSGRTAVATIKPSTLYYHGRVIVSEAAAQYSAAQATAYYTRSPFVTLEGTDTGVRSIQSVVSSHAHGANTRFMVMLVKPICKLPPATAPETISTFDYLAEPEGPQEMVVGSDGYHGCYFILSRYTGGNIVNSGEYAPSIVMHTVEV